MFPFLLSASAGIPVGITSSAFGLKTCIITAGTKKYESIIRKKKNKFDKIVLLVKTKLNSIEVLISKTVIDFNITRDDFFSINNASREYDDMNRLFINLIV